MKLKNFALLTVASLLIFQLLLVKGNKQKEGKKDRQKGAGKEENQKSPTRNGEKQKGAKGGRGSLQLQGKFVSKDKAECIWSVSGTETVAVNVECAKGETKISCAYGGNPTACPNYVANQKSYWKQITRALRKQKNLCQDQKAVLKSKECKKGPPEAHLRYLLPDVLGPSQEHKVQEGTSTKEDIIEPTQDCVEDADVLEKQRLAKEYCGNSWSSLCSFFFSMVQGKSC
ncbi:fibroblast growth factor-binding protein 1 [Dendrobates tinctorius]|uniref:fibroblast growth factor-binding protein 1 n=1 Tax=Dendrobates tinctorius TaxID=92724 RepID=UPI003CC9E50A